MFIIVGLGNPTPEYEGTRHNVGFEVIDALARKYNIDVDTKKHRAYIGKGMIEGQKVILAKPQTYMNLSGESVRSLLDYYKVDEEQELLVIYDDISLGVGQIRIRAKGSAGGHNGIKNIIAHLGGQVFPCNLIFNMFHLTFRNTLDNEVESPARNMAHTHNKTDPLPYNAHTLLIYLLHLPFHIQSVCHCSKD